MTDAPTHGRTGARGHTGTGALGHPVHRAPARPCARASSAWCVGACVLLLAAACRGREPGQAAATKETDVPVAINSGSPFQYPPDLYDQGVEGEVRLRLYVDSAGRVQPESTRVASSSGTPDLDSAAMRGAALLLFAPAHRNGQPVGMAFYQPVIFRRGAEPAGQPNP
jgi:TonB family protein